MSLYDRSLLQIFATEQGDHIARMRALLDELARSAAGNRSHLFEELLRRAHTLKGAARSVGLEPTELLAHRMEDKIVELHRSGAPLESTMHGGFRAALDAAEDILAAAIGSATLPDISAALRAMGEGTAAAPADGEGRERNVPERAAESATDFVRVRAGSLDELIRASSELLMSVKASSDGERIREHASRLEAADQEWARLRKRAETFLKAKGDPGTAAVTECFHYITAELNGLRREAHSAVDQIHATARRLQLQAHTLSRDALQIRMTPAETVFGGFGAMVRDLAQREGKHVEFSAEGLEVEADRLVLQALKDPVMHLLRNAVSHGVEPEAARLSRGKPAAGVIRLRIAVRGDRLRIDVEDDGQGLDRQAIAGEARRRGIRGALETDEENWRLEELIFQPGFSTAGAVTGISGRGMGLSAAREAVRKLHGEIRFRQPEGSGLIASLSAPLSIASQHVLLVSAGTQKFGLATAHIERLHRVPVTELRMFQGRKSVVLEEEPVPVAHLTSLLELGDGVAADSWLDIALLAVEGRRIALVVDAFVDQRDSIIRESGLPSSHAGMTAGAIPLEDGTVAAMLDATALWEKAKSAGAAAAVPAAERAVATKRAKILVVDDSITSRSLERTILEANGYQVELAVDGLEALERLQTDIPDLVITDVAMPRLTGFQLLERIKNDDALKNIPVILITSLESREDQERGLSLGADAYIVKRKFDQRELLSVIRQIL